MKLREFLYATASPSLRKSEQTDVKRCNWKRGGGLRCQVKYEEPIRNWGGQASITAYKMAAAISFFDAEKDKNSAKSKPQGTAQLTKWRVINWAQGAPKKQPVA